MKLAQAALYARVSSEAQASAQTIQSQLAALQTRIKAAGDELTVERHFIDEGYSGSTLVRPALERLRDLVAAGAVDRLYIHSPDRLARKYAYQVLLVDEFQRAGVEVVFLNRALGTSPEDDLLLQVQGMIADDAEFVFMQSHTAKVDASPALWRRGALHYPASKSEAMSASGALNR
jgi:site-specific DNA recombinase